MTDFVDDPDFVRALFDFTAEVAISYAPAQIAAGADTIAMSDAAASMIGPKLYAEFLWPAQRRVLQSIKTRFPHVLTRLHMCGRTDPLITQMRELPADVFELDFPVNLANARADLGSDKVILGNVSTITDLLEGTPEKVYEATARCHRTCGRFHVVGAGCEVSPLTPPENLRAMLEYAREHKP
jgi:MtaA/CmuA family methyltransferase